MQTAMNTYNLLATPPHLSGPPTFSIPHVYCMCMPHVALRTVLIFAKLS